ncbi:MAG: D-alanine-D-alanine ligase [Candidatus Jorgensenbacteria bacterium GW2011_GWA1_48_11]|uniref:D-alanine--D-alanine ligase n=1 Tax=Candidatus Jorgensenbacteria bacterium GW2011_GWA1_48_11 TaxID=1618660 RepID=A0A0G1UAG3_9BACT|nr:MAG: D-alanine-D-alanine ligase [Candidatus Jorgensenbacteria bacterium GW2011_GWA1_48_11]KKW11777.1 MAG: D-alanine-D-alanine ligase [Candidatus Jorgensenbacteria bacterium GW2011_GWB1_49_9]
MSNKVRITVLMGGPSHEYEVSLNSGKNVLTHLNTDKYHVDSIHIDKKGEWPLRPEHLKGKTDMAFIAMHGPYGEDGTIQSLLEAIELPYTGSNALVSALGMNKFLSLRHFRDSGLRIPLTILVSKKDWLRNAARVLKEINSYLEYPLVVKPNQFGSSVGVVFVNHRNDLAATLEKSFAGARDLIVQPFIAGKEVTCAVLDQGFGKTAYALPPTEIVPLASHFFDYESKYDPKGALEITPARLPETWLREIKQTAVRAHYALGCRGMSRTDMILGKDNKLYVLELNTIPGLTENSLLPKAALSVGIGFSQLLDRIINAGFLSSFGRK